ncbi:MAG TPA: site-2 protease family protein [Steroidobacteraceae bacterium]|nr:site-2 protease family protein [Steroidobacteraceae bacterium]
MRSANILLAMDVLATATPRTEARSLYRCARCGVESPERSCFVMPEPHAKAPLDTRCIICEEARLATGALDGAIGVLRTIFVPVMVLVLIQRGLGELTMSVLLVACLMTPISIIAHELGHAVAARLVGLTVGAIVIGVGRKLWSGEIFGTAVTLHAWPLSGLTFLGSQSLQFLRTRLWLATLMGPATNGLLVIVAVEHWPDMVETVGAPLLFLWIITNGLLAVQSLVPRRFQHAREMLSTDGLALLQIPRSTPEQLESYLFTASLLRAHSRFERRDYAGAREICLQGLELVPDNLQLRLLLSACYGHQQKYASSLGLLRQLLKQYANAESAVRAALENNTAFALLMSRSRAGYDSDVLIEADRLSTRAFTLYPCVLAYRSTRALVLTATGRPDEALELLTYSHYATAERTARGHRAVARAFALHRLGRADAAREAAAEAIRLDPDNAHVMAALDVLPVGDVPVRRQEPADAA